MKFPPDLTLWCSICIYTAERDSGPHAVTIINGHAVCTEHVGYVAGPTRSHQDILRFVVEQAGFDTLVEMQEANRVVAKEGVEPSRPERGTGT